MTTKVKGQPPSTVIREKLKAENRPVLVAFSCGKDAIATELALQESGIETVLAYMNPIPGENPRRPLKFIDEGIHRLEDQLGKEIKVYPHPSFYRLLNALVFQPPERCAIIEKADIPTPDFHMHWAMIREDLGLDPDTWVADGVRACDSIVRRAAFTKYGAMKADSAKVSPIYDWQIKEVRDIIKRHKIDLPIDYQWFGRSFDGIDYRFLKPVKDHAPEDYKQILKWFPLAEMEIMRNEFA